MILSVIARYREQKIECKRYDLAHSDVYLKKALVLILTR